MINELLRYEGRNLTRIETSESPTSPERSDGIPKTAYVHVPFCRRICNCCPFNKVVFEKYKAKLYVADFREEFRMYADLGYTFSSVEIGGGTPTTLTSELVLLIADLRKQNPDLNEVSIEAHPGDLTDQNIELLRDAGVDCLSIGVQSFNDNLLEKIDRSNGQRDMVMERIRKARENFTKVNVDLISGLPDETESQLEEDVDFLMNLEGVQGTIYPYMPQTKSEKVDTATEERFYEIILDKLLGNGYIASSPWCFAKDNPKTEYIARKAGYVGIGASAISHLGGRTTLNAFSLDRYHRLIKAGHFPIIGQRNLSPIDIIHDYLLTRLFGMEIDMDDVHEHFGHNPLIESEIRFMKARGIISGDKILRVTRRGMYPVGTMMKEFLIGLNSLRKYCIENKI